MRAPPLAIVVSAVVHAAVVAWLVVRSPAPRHTGDEPRVTPIEIVTVDRPPAAATPLDVRFEPPPPPAPANDAPAPSAPARRPGAAPDPRPPRSPVPPAAVAAGTAPSGSLVDQAQPPGHPPGRSPLFAMRRGEAPRLALPTGRWDDLDHAPRGTAPERDRTTGLLHESGGGNRSSDQGVFDATVRPDGSVALHDARNLNVHIALPTPRALGNALADWYESDKGPSGAEGKPTMARQIQLHPGSTTEPINPSEPRPKDRATTVILPVLAGGFDITDWLMRNHMQDPYGRRKLAFLDATRDERVQIGERGRAEQLARTPQIIHRTLEAVWAATADLGERKRALFELWDDCVETGEPAVVEAGAAARRMIIGFLRAHLPAGSADAFTAAEIAALARKQRSTAVFRPYE